MTVPLLVGLLIGIRLVPVSQRGVPATVEEAAAPDQRAGVQPPDEPDGAALPGPARGPFTRIFTAPFKPQAPALGFMELPEGPAGRQPMKPDVVCGMKVWSADPSIDPGIARPAPNASVDFKIRSLHPRPCAR